MDADARRGPGSPPAPPLLAIRSLPAELLDEVFVAGCLLSEDTDGTALFSWFHLWYSVCAQWRAMHDWITVLEQRGPLMQDVDTEDYPRPVVPLDSLRRMAPRMSAAQCSAALVFLSKLPAESLRRCYISDSMLRDDSTALQCTIHALANRPGGITTMKFGRMFIQDIPAVTEILYLRQENDFRANRAPTLRLFHATAAQNNFGPDHEVAMQRLIRGLLHTVGMESSLTSLTLRYCALSIGNASDTGTTYGLFMNTLSFLPSLEILDVVGNDFQDDFIDRMFVRGERSLKMECRIPTLKTLCARSNDFTEDALVYFSGESSIPDDATADERALLMDSVGPFCWLDVRDNCIHDSSINLETMFGQQWLSHVTILSLPQRPLRKCPSMRHNAPRSVAGALLNSFTDALLDFSERDLQSEDDISDTGTENSGTYHPASEDYEPDAADYVVVTAPDGRVTVRMRGDNDSWSDSSEDNNMVEEGDREGTRMDTDDEDAGGAPFIDALD